MSLLDQARVDTATELAEDLMAALRKSDEAARRRSTISDNHSGGVRISHS
jgi:hypothetical protein